LKDSPFDLTPFGAEQKKFIKFIHDNDDDTKLAEQCVAKLNYHAQLLSVLHVVVEKLKQKRDKLEMSLRNFHFCRFVKLDTCRKVEDVS